MISGGIAILRNSHFNLETFKVTSPDIAEVRVLLDDQCAHNFSAKLALNFFVFSGISATCAKTCDEILNRVLTTF